MIPRVTVLTCVYNGLPYLKEAVESVLAQTFSDFEYLIVDDASTDGSPAYLASLSDPRVRVLTNAKNLGTASSMNRGIKEAHGSIIMRLDQDDVSLPTRLERQFEYLNTHTQVAVVCSWEHTIDGQGRILRSWKATIANRGAFLGPLFLGLCPIWHPSLMVRKAAMGHIGGFLSSSWPAEDFDVTMRLALAGYGAAVVPEFLVLQRQHHHRQSIQSEGKQKAAMGRLHTEMMARFCPDASLTEVVAALLRCELAVSGFLSSKAQALRVLDALAGTMVRAAQSLEYTGEERAALECVVRARLGFGPTIGRRLRALPAPVWLVTFYGASPLLLPGLRRWVSTCYRIFCELRYPCQFFIKNSSGH